MSLSEEFCTPTGKVLSLDAEKKHPWSGRDVYNAYFTAHETNPTSMFVEFAIDKDLVTLKEAMEICIKNTS